MNRKLLASKATVYIPAYNVEEFLARCIEGLLAQSLPPDEILVIDDGSRDRSAEIAAGYREVTLIRQSRNQGLAATRNAAMQAARNDLVASIDADCVAEPTWLATLVNSLIESKAAGVGGKLREGVRNTLADRWRAAHMPQHWGDALVHHPQFLFGSNNLFRRSIVLEVGGYNEQMRTNGEDADLCDRLRASGYEFLYDPAARATHLRHDTTRSILDAYWRWWRFGVQAYARGVSLRSVLGHALFVHFRYNFLGPAWKDLKAFRLPLLAFDFLVLFYFPYRDFQLWRDAKRK